MQENIRKQVEDYLSGRLPTGDSAFESLLEQNPSDRKKLDDFSHQAAQIRSALRVPAELAPAPGFYARVMERVEIENKRQLSFWSIFTDPFGQRLVYASAVLIVLMGFTLFTSDHSENPTLAEAPVQILVDQYPEVHLVGDQSEDRGRVFMTLTSSPDQYADPEGYQ